MSFFDNQYQGRRGFLSNVPQVTRTIIIINCCVFFLSLLNDSFMTRTFALFYPSSVLFHWWQPITHMFMHGGFWHILFNMYTLFIFGSVVERVIGSKKFLLFYFVCGLGAAALHLGVESMEMEKFMEAAALGNSTAMENIRLIKMTPTVGASGAIYGILIAYAMIFPDSRMTLLFPPVTLSAKWMVVIFASIELFTGLTGLQVSVAHFAHLGGMLIGFLVMLFWRRRGILFDKDSLY